MQKYRYGQWPQATLQSSIYDTIDENHVMNALYVETVDADQFTRLLFFSNSNQLSRHGVPAKEVVILLLPPGDPYTDDEDDVDDDVEVVP